MLKLRPQKKRKPDQKLNKKNPLAQGFARKIVEECALTEEEFLASANRLSNRLQNCGNSLNSRKLAYDSFRRFHRKSIFISRASLNCRFLRFLVATRENDRLPRLILKVHFFDLDNNALWHHNHCTHSVVTNHTIQRLFERENARSLLEVRKYLRPILGWLTVVRMCTGGTAAQVPTAHGLFGVGLLGGVTTIKTYISKDELTGETLASWKGMTSHKKLMKMQPNVFTLDRNSISGPEFGRALQFISVGSLREDIKEYDETGPVYSNMTKADLIKTKRHMYSPWGKWQEK